jgi:hypothetical protein
MKPENDVGDRRKLGSQAEPLARSGREQGLAGRYFRVLLHRCIYYG